MHLSYSASWNCWLYISDFSVPDIPHLCVENTPNCFSEEIIMSDLVDLSKKVALVMAGI